MKHIIAVVAGLLLAFVGTSATYAATHTVCPSGCDYTSIQAAINASHNGDVINIATGTYNEHSLNTQGGAITIQGMVNGDGTLATTIDAQQGGSVFVFHSGETTGTVIRNLVITGGSTSGHGGGINCNGSSPTISNCRLEGNTTQLGGNGIFCDNSSPTIEWCVIEGNTGTALYGGGIYCYNNSNPTISDSPILGNTANLGGGIFCNKNSNPTITDCTIESNTANGFTSYGGGIYCHASSPTISDCTISDNTAYAGAGIFCESSSPTITDCTIGGEYGGNTASDSFSSGGGIYCYNNSNPVHSGCHFSGNTPDNVSGDSDWNPLRGEGGPSIITIENCTICGTGEHVSGLIVHLGENIISDCSDSGDLDGDGDVDVDDLALMHTATETCHHDVNHDGITDIDDLLDVIEGWGSSCTP